MKYSLMSFLSLCLLFLASYAGAVTAVPPLTDLPLGERWFSISMNDDRAGFARQTIAKHADGYQITVDSSVKITMLGFSREASIKESYLVKRDLTVRSFSFDQILDGSAKKVVGSVAPEGIRLTVENAGGIKHKTIKTKGPVYPPAAANLYPLAKGFVTGRTYRLVVLDLEEQKTKEVAVTAVGIETLPGLKEVFHLRNDLYTMVDNDIWIDRQGNMVKESVRDGLVTTQAEDATIATRFLADSALAKKDLVYDFSLIPTVPPVQNPAKLEKLVVELAGWPEDLAVPDGARQKVIGRSARNLTISLAPVTSAPGEPLADAGRKSFLGANERIIPDHPEIRSLAATIIGEEKDPVMMITLLTGWVAGNIEGTVTDSQSPVETLQIRKGNCQSHARLYASLARAAGIPTRFVSGLVYEPGKGFLYHSWAESYAGAWVPVDPTFNQVPADLTHIRLFDGDEPGDFAPLARVIGRLTATIVTQDYATKPVK